MDLDRYLAELEEHRREAFENLVFLPSVDSTTHLARRIASDCLEETDALGTAVVLALEQTAGRGRRGSPWASPAGMGVYTTVILPLAGGAGGEDAAVLPTLSLLTAVALCRTVNRHLPADRPCRLKWPNDLLVGGAKIAGILIETFSRGDRPLVALVSFGVNHGQGRGELPVPEATSLALVAPELPPLGALTWQLLEALESELAHLGDTAYAVEQYASRSLHSPGDRLRCRTGGGTLEGTFRGFDERGFLRLENDGREVLLPAGEVHPP